jgi:CheY-like chemotaxis protein
MSKPLDILLVDDQPDFIEPVAFWLESKGYAVRSASTGQDALHMIKEQAPDIVFLDIKMPVMDGVETLRRLRRISKDLPVIMITAYEHDEKFTEARKLGISGFFYKKDNLEDLGNLLEPILRAQKRMKSSQ